jgi:glycosyltransferase involved in cell wall biosynthesis
MTEPVPQRAVIVVPTTAEYDSRTYRLASSLAARGHTVTVLGRWRLGLEQHERHEAGYDIVRVPATARDGVPPGLRFDRVRDQLRARLHRGSRPTTIVTAGAPATTGSGPAPNDGTAAAAEPAAGPIGTPAYSTPRVVAPPGMGILDAVLPERAVGPVRRVILPARRLYGSTMARLAIPLTIRAHRQATGVVAPPADLYHGMAYMAIPVALALGKRDRAPVVYDARDIYVDAANVARMPLPMRKLLARWEKSWARRADRVFTVNRHYAEVMARRWRVREPLVVMNCSYRTQPPAERPRRFHETLGLAPDERVVVYQGGFSHDRGIEQLIEAIPSVPGATLVLLGYGKLQAELEEIAADPSTGGRVRIVPAVPPSELLGWIASADVVAMPIQPTTLNHRLTTPNKLFEAMAAGVPVVASDLPGMAAIVRESGCGVLVDPTDPAAIAAALREVLATPETEMAAWRARCSAAALETYNWERQMELVLDEYGRLTGKPW